MRDHSETSHPKVFVSYSHDDDNHQKRILGLAERLRADGFETMIDHYVEGTPPQGWPRWMLSQIDWADYILLVCTKTYYRRFRGQEASDGGKGVDWEGAIITNELYDKKSSSTRFVPVLFDSVDSDYIPEPVRSFSFYVLTSESAYTKLTDYLAGVAGIQPAELGPPPNPSRRTGSPLSFEEGIHTQAKVTVQGRAVPDLSVLPAPGGMMSADEVL
jgi:SEFIR domain